MAAHHKEIAPGFFVLVTLEDESVAFMPIHVHARILGVRGRDRRSVPDRSRSDISEEILSRSDRDWCVAHDEGRSIPISKLCAHDWLERALGCIGKSRLVNA